MRQDITKNQICLLLKNGVQFWMSQEKSDLLYETICPTDPNKARPEFIRLGDENARFFRTEISGFFTPLQVEELTRRKNGQWQCQNRTWHDRFTKCECINQETRFAVQTLEEKIKNCGKCKEGYTSFRNSEGVWEEKKCVCIS